MSTKILVVDDSPTLRKVVAGLLDDRGYATVTAENGEEALAKLRAESVDLVITDFVMPRMNGYQLCREVRADPALAAVPVVLMSAKGDKIRGQFVTQTGAVDALTKPFDPLALYAVVENALSRRRSRDAEPADGPPSSDRAGRDAEPPSLSIPPVALASDPGLRRQQVAEHVAGALARILAPEMAQDGAETPEIERARAGLRRALTPERLGSLVGPLRQLEEGPEAKTTLSGDLSCISIPEVLQMLELQRQSGALTISSSAAEITLYLREGRLDLALGRGLPASFRLGRYLVQQGSLSRDDLLRFLETRGSSRRLIGDALVQQGLATEADVQAALKSQTCELVYEVVSWKEGRFTFARGGTSPEATLSPLGLVPGGIVMEGFRRVDEWSVVEGSFDFGDVLTPDPVGAERARSSPDFTRDERAVLDAVDGARSVRQIVDSVDVSTFDACKILHQLLSSGAVRRHAPGVAAG